MKIYFDGVVYYTRERFLEMVRSNAEYIIDPSTTYYSNKIGYAKESVSVDGRDWMVFKTEQLDDEEILDLLPRLYGGFISSSHMKELCKSLEIDFDYGITKIREIEVKE